MSQLERKADCSSVEPERPGASSTMLETGVVAIECVGVAFMNLAARGAMRAYKCTH